MGFSVEDMEQNITGNTNAVYNSSCKCLPRAQICSCVSGLLKMSLLDKHVLVLCNTFK